MLIVIVLAVTYFAAWAVLRMYHAYFTAHAFDGIEYTAYVDREEIFESEYVTLCQSVTNRGDRAIPCLKMQTLLPEGLWFVIPDQRSVSGRRDKLLSDVESILHLPPKTTVTRRFRILCTHRGVFRLVSASLLRRDLTGIRTVSRRFGDDAELRPLTVLPRALWELREIAMTSCFEGYTVAPDGLVPDPTLVIGAREYTTLDPFRSIHWKASARAGHLMVRETEQQKNDVYSIVLNMQSALLEPHGGLEISTPANIEGCISVCASLLDSALAVGTPVRLYANHPTTPPSDRLYESGEVRSARDLHQAYCALAAMPMKMSMSLEAMIDLILADPHAYTRGGNMIFVSSYLGRRMIQFWQEMQKRHLRVIFFITTDYQNEHDLPEDMEVWYRYRSGRFGREVPHETSP